MNKIECDILLNLITEKYKNQRYIANRFTISLGKCNKILNKLKKLGYLDDKYVPSNKAIETFINNKPNSAVILASGGGFRMIPIIPKYHKALIEVKGEVLIERLIKQLKQVGIQDIKIIVGYMKERFEYLIDKYNVKLIVNMEYASTNNLHSLYHAKDYLINCYIVPCNLYFEKNPFQNIEPYSWYMVLQKESEDSIITVNSKEQIIRATKDHLKNKMLGVAYICQEDGNDICTTIEKLYKNPVYNDAVWEEILLYNKNRVYAKIIDQKNVAQFNQYSDLQKFDNSSKSLDIEILDIIANALQINKKQIENIDILKAGMTNRSFTFSVDDEEYIMRIPGEGTDKLINRQQEGKVYDIIGGLDISDEVVYFNKNQGFKLSKKIQNAHNCNSKNFDEVGKCMKFLREFHNRQFKIDNKFDIFERIDFYESLWGNEESIFVDYQQTKKHVFELKEYIEEHEGKYVLTHIDAVPDNFLLFNKDGKEQLRLIDWEYAGMQDPHVDIAMFAIYAQYDFDEVNKLISLYFVEGCNKRTKIKIYCYIACCGLLWSNWCEYKRMHGIEFGEYSLHQYHYAKEYYNLVMQERKKENEIPSR